MNCPASLRFPAVLALLLASLGATAAAAALPHPKHVVVVVEENKSRDQIVGSSSAPYLNALLRAGALFTDAHGVTHPSLPNYLALFSGRTNDNGDGCPASGIDARAPNLASELLAAHLTFAAYSEALPATGWTGCSAGTYARKHAPWVAFRNVPAALSHPLEAFRIGDALPTLAFVIPDVDDDMHDGSIAAGDAWFSRRLGALVHWAQTHDTLVVVTWDEGYDSDNTVATFFVGPMVKPGRYGERVDHYRVLRTLEDLYALPHAGRSADVAAIGDCWR